MKRIVAWGLFVLAFVYYYITDFSEKSEGIPCVFKAITGYNCSGCGTQRAFHSLLHLEWKEAFFYNPLFVLFLPFYLYLLYFSIESYIVKRKVNESFLLDKKYVIPFVIIMILFAILRNLPYYPFSLFYV